MEKLVNNLSLNTWSDQDNSSVSSQVVTDDRAAAREVSTVSERMTMAMASGTVGELNLERSEIPTGGMVGGLNLASTKRQETYKAGGMVGVLKGTLSCAKKNLKLVVDFI